MIFFPIRVLLLVELALSFLRCFPPSPNAPPCSPLPSFLLLPPLLTPSAPRPLPLHFAPQLPSLPPLWKTSETQYRMSPRRLGSNFARYSVSLPRCNASLRGLFHLRLLPPKPVPSRRRWKLTAERLPNLPVYSAHLEPPPANPSLTPHLALQTIV